MVRTLLEITPGSDPLIIDEGGDIDEGLSNQPEQYDEDAEE